jgi:WD40 repeat protein
MQMGTALAVCGFLLPMLLVGCGGSRDDPCCELVGNTNGVTNIAFLGGGSHLVSAGKDGSIRLWGLSNCKQLNVCYPHGKDVYVNALGVKHFDEDIVLSAGDDNRICLTNAVTGEVVRSTFWKAGKVTYVSSIPDSSSCIVISYGNIYKLDMSGNEGPTKKVSADAQAAAIDPLGQKLITGSRYGEIQVWDLPTLRCEGQILTAHKGEVKGIAFFPGGGIGGFDRSRRIDAFVGS